VRALNEAIRAACARTGATLLDFAAYPVASDARLWSDDRLHANADGHARMAAALAYALGLPGTDTSWQAPLPERPPRRAAERLAGELRWYRGHFLPWLWQHVHGRSSANGQGPKRPALVELARSR
jgi:hypothetical protein